MINAISATRGWVTWAKPNGQFPLEPRALPLSPMCSVLGLTEKPHPHDESLERAFDQARAADQSRSQQPPDQSLPPRRATMGCGLPAGP